MATAVRHRVVNLEPHTELMKERTVVSYALIPTLGHSARVQFKERTPGHTTGLFVLMIMHGFYTQAKTVKCSFTVRVDDSVAVQHVRVYAVKFTLANKKAYHAEFEKQMAAFRDYARARHATGGALVE
jgi:hypothetical protein